MRRYPILPATLAAAALVTLAACNRTESTVGQQADPAAGRVEQPTVPPTAGMNGTTGTTGTTGMNSTTGTTGTTGTNSAADTVRDTASQAIDATANKVKDAAITTTVNAELARDSSLSALKINVDTSAGRVSLKGTAPDEPARERATQLAQRVDGVVSVDNQLRIGG